MTPPAAPVRPPARWPEALFALATRSAGLLILAVVLGLVGVLVVQSWPALREAGSNGLFTSASWVPKPRDGEPQRFGALAFVYGTVVTSVIAMLLAVPFGVAAAAFLSEIAPPWLRKAGAFLIELLAAIPSVVYGFWGLFFLAPQLQKLFDLLGGPNTGGNGILAAGVILAKANTRTLRLHIDVRNLTDRLNVISFAGLFSGTALAAPRSVAVRLQAEF